MLIIIFNINITNLPTEPTPLSSLPYPPYKNKIKSQIGQKVMIRNTNWTYRVTIDESLKSHDSSFLTSSAAFSHISNVLSLALLILADDHSR